MVTNDDRKTFFGTAVRLREEFVETGEEENLTKAETFFREAIQRFHNLWMSHFGLGELLLLKAARSFEKSGPVFSEGVTEVTRATELDPNQAEPQLKLASTLAALDINTAERYYSQALKTLKSRAEPMYPVLWQAIDHWKFAILAAEASHQSISIDAFCRAIEIDDVFAGKYTPSHPLANAAWQSALKKLGKAGWFELGRI